jgi:hypothetical protein
MIIAIFGFLALLYSGYIFSVVIFNFIFEYLFNNLCINLSFDYNNILPIILVICCIILYMRFMDWIINVNINE